jgi:hypothetical protein
VDPTCVSTTFDPRGRVLLLLWLEWLLVVLEVVEPLCELCLLPIACLIGILWDVGESM